MGLIYGAALTLPSPVASQQSDKIWRIGNVHTSTYERAGYLAQALEQRLADLGYVQGRLLHRFAGAQPDKVEEAIVSLLPQIDLLVVRGTMGGMAAKKVVRGVPIVFVSVAAP